MAVKGQSGQLLNPLYNIATFAGFVSDIVVDQTTVTAVFDPVTDKTTISWDRPESEKIVGIDAASSEKYFIYRKKKLPIADFDDHDDLSNAIPSREIFSELEYTESSAEFDVPIGTYDWYFYALVIRYEGLEKIVVPRWGVWESVEGPDDGAAPVLSLGSEISPNPGHKKVNLEWTAISGASGYKLFYSRNSMSDNTDLEQWKKPPLFADLIVDTSTTVTGLQNSVKYYFRVRAVDTTTEEEGPFSNELEATPVPDVTPPNRISDTEITAEDLGTDGSVRVCWSSYVPPADIVSYRVYYSTSAFTDTASAVLFSTVDKTKTCVDVTGLENGVTYYFAVVPVDEAGNSFDDNLNNKQATPTAPATTKTLDEPITVTVANDIIGVTGIPAPHVIYGLLRLPAEFTDQVPLEEIEVSLSIKLTAAGGYTETTVVYTDSDGFWSANLANLEVSEWKDGDDITINVKDWNSTFIGTASLKIDEDAGAQRVDILLTDSSLRPPVLISPITGGVSEYPVFKLYSETVDPELEFRFKIEVSDDNFRTIFRVFDETSSFLGWSRETMKIDDEDTTIVVYRSFQDDRLVNGETYQWRAYTWNGVRFSSPSNIAQFNVVSEQLDKISEEWSFDIDADKIVELFAVDTDTGRFEGTFANGITITDSTPIFEWILNDITVNNVHFRFEIDTNSAFDNSDGKLRIFESKEVPEGFEYSLDNGRTWQQFERTGSVPGVQKFRFVLDKNLEVQ